MLVLFLIYQYRTYEIFITWLSNLHKPYHVENKFSLLNSFFVFSRWSASTLHKSGLSYMHFRNFNYLLLVKICLLFHSFYTVEKYYPIIGILFINGIFIPKLLNNTLASCSLINFDLLQPETAQFDESIVLPFFVFTTFGFLISVFFLHFKQ